MADTAPVNRGVRTRRRYSAPVALLAASLLTGPPDPDREPLDPAWPPVLIALFVALAVTAIVVGVVFVRRARASIRGNGRGE
jgi:H+/Cl- antiporter ClcA